MNPMQIIGPVLGLVALGVWLTLSPNIMGATNSWYMQTKDACVVDGERFDRVVPKPSSGDDDAETAWQGATSSTIKILANTTADECNNSSMAIGDYYTPAGTPVDVTTANEMSDAEWEGASPVFTEGGMGQIIQLILQATNVAPPLAIMTVLGLFGAQFVSRVTSNPIVAAVIVLLGFMLVAVVLNALVPFLDVAYHAVDPDRFIALNEGLGVIGPLVRRFWGVIAVAGILVVGWQVVGQMRQGSMNKSGYGGM